MLNSRSGKLVQIGMHLLTDNQAHALSAVLRACDIETRKLIALQSTLSMPSTRASPPLASKVRRNTSSFDFDLPSEATNGIVLATEKKSSSPLADQSSLAKISNITPNIGMVYSGMGPDYRILVDRARKVSHTNYKRIYNEYPPTRILVQDVARVMQEATQSAGVRPYGVSLLVAGWDEGIEPEEEEEPVEGEEKKKTKKTGGIHKGGPMLYQVDPSGSYYPWKATAIGKSATKAKTFLEKRYSEELELEDAIHIALLTLKDNIEGEMNGDTIEIGESLISVVVESSNIDRYRGSPGRPFTGYRGCRGRCRPSIQKVDSSRN